MLALLFLTYLLLLFFSERCISFWSKKKLGMCAQGSKWCVGKSRHFARCWLGSVCVERESERLDEYIS